MLQLETHVRRGIPHSTLPVWPGTIGWISQGPRIEPNMTGERKKKINEMIANDILLYSQTGA